MVPINIKYGVPSDPIIAPPGSCQCSPGWGTDTAIDDPAEVVPEDRKCPESDRKIGGLSTLNINLIRVLPPIWVPFIDSFGASKRGILLGNPLIVIGGFPYIDSIGTGIDSHSQEGSYIFLILVDDQSIESDTYPHLAL